MPIEDIKALPVESIAADDSLLWLWTTNAHLRAAFDVVDAWGFEYKTLLTWVKDRMGTGEWLRGQTEHCLLAARGKPVFVNGNHTTVIEAARREHSRKPEEFYALVEATSPDATPANRGQFQRALAFAGLGDRDRTLEALEKWADVGPVRMGFTLNGPEFAFVRADPRLKALRKKVGLPD